MMLMGAEVFEQGCISEKCIKNLYLTYVCPLLNENVKNI